MIISLQSTGALTATECTALLPHCSASQKHTSGPASENQSQDPLAAEDSWKENGVQC